MARNSWTKLGKTPRSRPYESSLDRAAGFELTWGRVVPVFEQARKLADPCFVYFIGEQDDGHIKIGTAKDPVCRLRELQTGNPRSLSIEYVVLGDRKLERLLHGLWWEFGMTSMRERDTEWFRPRIRKYLPPILDLAIEQQIIAVEGGRTTSEELDRIVHLAHIAHGM